MPTFGHIFYALAVLIPIFYFAREKFSYKLAFIYLISNIYGPDIYFLIGFLPISLHTLIGFVITAIPLSLVFSYISRYSIEKSEGKIPVKVVDSGVREISWINAFCATAAGGFSHFFIDFIFHRELTTEIFPVIEINDVIIFPGINIPLQSMHEWSGIAYHTMNPLIVIGEFLVVLMILSSLIYLKKGFKETLIVLGIATAIELLLMILVSPEVNGGEREYSVMFVVTIYIFIPMMLLFFAARNVNDKKYVSVEKQKINPKIRLTIIAIVSSIFGIAMFAYGMVAIFMSDVIVGLIGGLAVATPVQIQTLGIFYSVFAGLHLVGSIGLFFRSNLFRIFAIIGSAYFLIFGFPIGIAFFLFENDIKNLFHRIPPIKTE